ncbi:MAG TPA: hypothetical protein VGB49_00845 [Caulobacteraceae bacterium]|jgi:hypothetical protein
MSRSKAGNAMTLSKPALPKDPLDRALASAQARLARLQRRRRLDLLHDDIARLESGETSTLAERLERRRPRSAS